MALSIGQKAGWGLADMGVVVFVVVKQFLVLTYLTAFLGVPVAIAGFVTTAVLIFDMITDPLIGYLSDKTQSRFGRRAPWMFVGVLVMSAGMVGLFSVPVGMEMSANLAWVIAFFVLATIGFTMVAIPYGAQSGEITQDPKERSAMTGWRMAFASVGILIGGAVIPGLAGSMGYAMAALAVTPLMVGAVWLSLWSIRKAPRTESAAQVSIGGMFGLVFANNAFVALYGVMTLAIALITAGLPFAALYLIIDSGDTALSGAATALSTLSLMFAAFVIGSILSQAVWVLLSNRIGKVSALIIGLTLYVVLLYALNTQLPSVNVTAIAGMFVLAGMTNGSYQQIPWAMYPYLMDVTRRTSGVAIEGAFSAVWLFGKKFANVAATAVLGLTLAGAGWQETSDGIVAKSDGALAALLNSITLIPAVILIVAIIGLAAVYRPMAVRALA
jgi:GPH family glycoside/pentoside/hexuronide:cation symporter